MALPRAGWAEEEPCAAVLDLVATVVVTNLTAAVVCAVARRSA